MITQPSLQAPPKISAYGFIFAATTNDFDIESAVANYCAFFDEVVLATIPLDQHEDDTPARLAALTEQYANLKVVYTDIKFKENNRFDGQLKTAAMLRCTHPIRVILDCDERFPLSQRDAWYQLAARLNIDRCDGYLIPVIDLYGSDETVRANAHVGQKFRMHKTTVTERGVPRRFDYGLRFDTSRSDSTEALLRSGEMARFESIVNPMYLQPVFMSNLKGSVYVVHYGFRDLQRRADLGKRFWKSAWEARSGRPENVATDISHLDKEPLMRHNLPLE